MTWSLCPARRPKDSTRAKVLLSNSNAISHDLRCRRCDVYHTFLFGKFSVESERRAKPYQGSMQRKGAPFRVDQIPVAAALAGSSYDGAWNLFFVMHRDIRDPTYNLRSTKGATANPRSPTANGRFAPEAAHQKFRGKAGCLAAISNSLAMERRGGRDGGGRFAAYEGRSDFPQDR
jgi:hypothetical protein